MPALRAAVVDDATPFIRCGLTRPSAMQTGSAWAASRRGSSTCMRPWWMVRAIFTSAAASPVGDVIANRIAKWNGSAWSALGSGMKAGTCQCAGGVGHEPVCGRLFHHGGRGVGQLHCQVGRERVVGLGFGDEDSTGRVYALAVSAPTCMRRLFHHGGRDRGQLHCQMERERLVGLGLGDERPIRRMRWRCRARTCMREAISPRRAGSRPTNIAKWNGSAWSALGSGMNNRASGLCAGGVGHDLYAGG